MTTALRSFLRYVRYRGDITLDLAAAVPVVANWSMPSIPRANLSRSDTRSCWLVSIDGPQSVVATTRSCCCSRGWGCALVKWSSSNSRISTGTQVN